MSESAKKKQRRKLSSANQQSDKTEPLLGRVHKAIVRLVHKLAGLRKDYLSRRPHRTFRRTLRRDYRRSLDMPGYFSFTASVWRIGLHNKGLFTRLVLFYAIAGMIFVGLSSQDTYSQLSDLIDETGSGVLTGEWGSIGKAGLLLFSGATGSFTPELSDVQQVYSVLLFLLTWLTTVWLLRSILAGNRPKLRDGLYRASAPIVATIILLVIMALQFIPAVLGVVAFNAAISSGLFDSGLLAMVISFATGLLIILSLYWATSTAMGLIVVTLPGMYPWEAIRAAGDLVVGRRLRILMRLLWMLVCNAVLFAATLLPIISIERLIKQTMGDISWLPVVPIAVSIVTSLIAVWSATYIYMLYRKVVDDDASPA